MLDIKNFDVSSILVRPDRSYVINNGLYHVPNEGEWVELYNQVKEYTESHPELVKDDPAFMPLSEKDKETMELQAELDSLQEYLKSTDWYAIRYADTGDIIPDDVKAKRQKARERIDYIRGIL